jgi:hypothetical protein
MTPTRWQVGIPDSPSERNSIWASLVREFRDRIGFAHIDLIPDDGQLAAMNATAEVHEAFRALSLAAQQSRRVAVLASSGPGPLGMHIELALPDVFTAFEVYGPYSINIDVWRESDRDVLAYTPDRSPRPDPLIDQLDSMDAIILSLDETELGIAHAWAARAGVRIKLLRR